MAEPVEPYEICEYQTEDGRSPFAQWLEGLRDRGARARIDARLARARLGNLGDYRAVGEGVYELRSYHGPIVLGGLPESRRWLEAGPTKTGFSND